MGLPMDDYREAAIKFIKADLNFADERRMAQLADVLIPLDPLRERKTIIRRELGGLGFEFFDVHGGKLPRSIARAKGKVGRVCISVRSLVPPLLKQWVFTARRMVALAA